MISLKGLFWNNPMSIVSVLSEHYFILWAGRNGTPSLFWANSARSKRGKTSPCHVCIWCQSENTCSTVMTASVSCDRWGKTSDFWKHGDLLIYSRKNIKDLIWSGKNPSWSFSGYIRFVLLVRNTLRRQFGEITKCCCSSSTATLSFSVGLPIYGFMHRICENQRLH